MKWYTFHGTELSHPSIKGQSVVHTSRVHSCANTNNQTMHAGMS